MGFRRRVVNPPPPWYTHRPPSRRPGTTGEVVWTGEFSGVKGVGTQGTPSTDSSLPCHQLETDWESREKRLEYSRPLSPPRRRG